MKTLTIPAIILVFVSIATVIGYKTYCYHSDKREAVEIAKADSTAKAEIKSNWQYDTLDNKMEGTTTMHAYTVSTNVINFDFPHAGGSNGKLQINNNGFGRNPSVYFGVTDGHIISHSHNVIRARFDDNPAEIFECNAPSTHEIDIVILEDPLRFYTMAKKAKKILIEASYYQAGRQIFEFDTEGLNFEITK